MPNVNTVVIDHITPIEWRAVLRVGHDVDINKGGLWDARSGCVNIWAAPDDKPEGWPANVEITQGGLDYPRSFVADVSMQWPEDGPVNWDDREHRYPVVADITCYDLHEAWKATLRSATAQALGRSSTYSFGAVADRMRSQVAHQRSYRCPGDVAWIKKHWATLIEAARAEVPKPLQLELGQPSGHCLRGHVAYRIARVVSSPWTNGVGDWTDYCPTCKMLTATVEATDFTALLPPGAIGRVIGVG
jgi:hypothetical protein